MAPTNAEVMAGTHKQAGKTILEMLWEQAGVQYGQYIDMEVNTKEFYIQQGKLGGLAYAIAKLLNPAKPDVQDVKNQIRDQWNAEHEDDEED